MAEAPPVDRRKRARQHEDVLREHQRPPQPNAQAHMDETVPETPPPALAAPATPPWLRDDDDDHDGEDDEALAPATPPAGIAVQTSLDDGLRVLATLSDGEALQYLADTIYIMTIGGEPPRADIEQEFVQRLASYKEEVALVEKRFTDVVRVVTEGPDLITYEPHRVRLASFQIVEPMLLRRTAIQPVEGIVVGSTKRLEVVFSYQLAGWAHTGQCWMHSVFTWMFANPNVANRIAAHLYTMHISGDRAFPIGFAPMLYPRVHHNDETASAVLFLLDLFRQALLREPPPGESEEALRSLVPERFPYPESATRPTVKVDPLTSTTCKSWSDIFGTFAGAFTNPEDWRMDGGMSTTVVVESIDRFLVSATGKGLDCLYVAVTNTDEVINFEAESVGYRTKGQLCSLQATVKVKGHPDSSQNHAITVFRSDGMWWVSDINAQVSLLTAVAPVAGYVSESGMFDSRAYSDPRAKLGIRPIFKLCEAKTKGFSKNMSRILDYLSLIYDIPESDTWIAMFEKGVVSREYRLHQHFPPPAFVNLLASLEKLPEDECWITTLEGNAKPVHDDVYYFLNGIAALGPAFLVFMTRKLAFSGHLLAHLHPGRYKPGFSMGEVLGGVRVPRGALPMVLPYSCPVCSGEMCVSGAHENALVCKEHVRPPTMGRQRKARTSKGVRASRSLQGTRQSARSVKPKPKAKAKTAKTAKTAARSSSQRGR